MVRTGQIPFRFLLVIAMLATAGTPSLAQHGASGLSGKLCADGGGYEIDFSGSISGTLINQRFMGHWRLRKAGIIVTWQMVDEGGQTGYLTCSLKGTKLTCREGGSTTIFTCRKGGDTF